MTETEMINNRPSPDRVEDLAETTETQMTDVGNGDVLIAAITSCTNTSNPAVMIAAGIVAKKASEKGMKVKPFVKTSLAPGSRVVTEYLNKTGLQKYLDELGFNLVGYGCTTCIGNSGPLDAGIEEAIVENDLIAASVLSGNRNFEARVHQNIKANFLMSPPLVVAYALAGSVLKDVNLDAIGQDKDGNDVFLKDVWASLDEVREQLSAAFDRETYKRLYKEFAEENPLWNEIPTVTGKVYRMGRKLDIHSGAAVFRRFFDGNGRIFRHQKCAGVGNFRRFGHDRSYFSGWCDQTVFARRTLFTGKMRGDRRFQLLRFTARKRPRNAARNFRERPHQKSDGFAERRRFYYISTRRN